ncbi:hypothetical protein Mapa_016033 [Marchantia paleacea]|nr:hypothetical protein Mapa_016033 [Marchantia paleacea]
MSAEAAMEDVHATMTTCTTASGGDPQPSHSEDEAGIPSQMGSGRRDARVVCETFTGRDFKSGTASDSRRMASTITTTSSSTDTHKSSKHFKRRGVAYSHSRNPLLACFIGESVLSSRAIRLNPNCDSASSQRAFFSLIPVDSSRVNERTGEPSSPQLSCIGQVKCRQAKAPRGLGAGAVVEDLAQLDLTTERKESAAAAPGGGRFGNRRSLERGRSFDLAAAAAAAAAVDDIPPLDLNEGTENPRLMRSTKRPGSLDASRKAMEVEKQQGGSPLSPTVSKHSIQHFNHLIKQLLGASMIRTGFICGWNSRDSTLGDDDACGPDEEEEEATADHYEIDLSRFASCEMQAKTPSFRDTRYYQTSMGKKLADIRVHAHQQHASHVAAPAAAEVSVDEHPDHEKSSSSSVNFSRANHHPTIVIKCSVERRKPSSEATLWKRRCMDRPLSLEVKR